VARRGAQRARAAGGRGFTLIELLAVIAVLVVLVAMLLPSLRSAREMARQSICMTQLRQLGWGFVEYEAEWGAYPGNSVWQSDLSVDYANWVYCGLGIGNHGGNVSEAVTRGSLFPYVGTLGIYHCPNDTRHTYRSYSMNTNIGTYSAPHHWPVYGLFYSQRHGHAPGDTWYCAARTAKVYRPDWTLVFLEEGIWLDDACMAWALMYISGDVSPDAPVIRHRGGFVGSYVDGHVEWHRVMDGVVRSGSESPEEQTAMSFWVLDHPQNLMPTENVYPP